MPGYTWVEETTGDEVMVIRSVEDRDVPPRLGEMTPKQSSVENPKWKRIVKGIQTVRGPNWGGGKGNW